MTKHKKPETRKALKGMGSISIVCILLLLTGCSNIPTGTPNAATAKTQIWQKNGKQYPIFKKDGVEYLAVPAEDQLLSEEVLAPEAPNNKGTTIRINISNQRAWLYKNGILERTSVCCPGKPGHETPKGMFHVISKETNHQSTIYHVPMPYMLRLSTAKEDIGIHEGFICTSPASHGCIRLPKINAIKFFQSTPIGAKVLIE